MQIDFKALEKALAPIEEIGQGELTFDAGGTTLTLRVLRPSEEVEAQKYASVALNSGDDHAAVEYLDLFRLGCLSHAIVAVGPHDFRNVDFVLTGEALENGNSIKVPKYKALRDLLSRWTRSALSGVFTKFHELLMQTEMEAEKAIEYKPANIPAEIDRLHQRIAELRGEIEKQEAIERTKFSEKVAAVESLSQNPGSVIPRSPSQTQEEAPEDMGIEGDDEPEPVAPPQVSRRTGPITPQAAPPPERTAPAVNQQRAPVSPPPRPDSSFINVDDDDSMNAALAAEHHRILEMRRRAAAREPPMDEASALEKVHPQLQHPGLRRRPPHQDAADVEAEVGLVDAVVQQARHMGTLEGKEVFALPAQDLDTPTQRVRPDRSVLDPKVTDGGSRNPRFQSPRRS